MDLANGCSDEILLFVLLLVSFYSLLFLLLCVCFLFRGLPVVQVPMQSHDVGAIWFRMLDGYCITEHAWVVNTLGHDYHHDLCLITLVVVWWS